MEPDFSDDANEILATLKRVEQRLDELREEREQLLQANRMLTELVTHLETELEQYVPVADEEDEAVKSFKMEGYEYSFKQGWRKKGEAHRERLDLGASEQVDEDDIKDQLSEVQQSIKQIKKLRQ